jgi:hypothetical protein
MISRSPVLAGSSMGDNAEKAIVEYREYFAAWSRSKRLYSR